MKKTNLETKRTPARKLSKQELETGVLAAGCCTQGCCGDDIILEPSRPIGGIILYPRFP